MGNEACCSRESEELKPHQQLLKELADIGNDLKDAQPAFPLPSARTRGRERVREESSRKAAELRILADAGGLCFCCGSVEAPDGDLELLVASVEQMHKDPAARLFGKLMVSAGHGQAAAVAFVPEELQEALHSTVWLSELLEWFGGYVVRSSGDLAAGVVLGRGRALLRPMLQRAKAILRQRELLPDGSTSARRFQPAAAKPCAMCGGSGSSRMGFICRLCDGSGEAGKVQGDQLSTQDECGTSTSSPFKFVNGSACFDPDDEMEQDLAVTSFGLGDDKPGLYTLLVSVNLTGSRERGSCRLETLPPGTTVDVLHVVLNGGCVRGLVESPAGWISLAATDGSRRWAAPADVAQSQAEVEDDAAEPDEFFGASTSRCPHELTRFRVLEERWVCSECGEFFPLGAALFGCSLCAYDQCTACHEAVAKDQRRVLRERCRKLLVRRLHGPETRREDWCCSAPVGFLK